LVESDINTFDNRRFAWLVQGSFSELTIFKPLFIKHLATETQTSASIV